MSKVIDRESVRTSPRYWSAMLIIGYGIVCYYQTLILRIISTRGVGSALRSGRFLRRLGVPPLLLALCVTPVTLAAGPVESAAPDAVLAFKKSEESRIWMTIGERRFSITLANTDAARAFFAMLPLTLDMEELNGNEKKKELSSPLHMDASRPGTIHNGDLLLWGARTVVVFYLTFESPCSYTRLGRVDDPSGLPQSLGRSDVRVVFSKT